MNLLSTCIRSIQLTTLLWLTSTADIIWNGARVSSWPAQALPELSVKAKSKVLSKIASNSSGMGYYPNPTGTIQGLTLLVDFSDQPATVSKQDADEWLNKEGFNKNGCNGSVRDYFTAISNGKVDLQNQVYGFYRAAKPKSYYEGGSGYDRAGELLNEVLNHFDGEIDYSQFDNDKDGNTESISIVYAGAGAVWGQGIWPHSGWVGQKRDGVQLTRYMMTDMPGEFSIYVFAHESGHMIFGWPDLYWFGDYCIMGNRMSDTNPVLVNDFFRADQGWIPFIDVTSTTNGFFKTSVNGESYRYVNPSRSTEGFFWSQISNTGHNTSLQGSGLLLFHYDMDEDGNTGANNLQLRIVQADNQAHLQASQWPNPGNESNDLFRSNTSAEFSVAKSSYSAWYNGSPSALRIWEISAVQDSMSFKLGTGEEPVEIKATQPKVFHGYKTMRWNLLGQKMREGVIHTKVQDHRLIE